MNAKAFLAHAVSLLLVLCLFPLPGLAVSGGESDADARAYESALSLLNNSNKTDLEKLKDVKAGLDQAGSYQFGVEYLNFVDALIILQDNETANYDLSLNIIRRLSGNAKFTEDYYTQKDRSGRQALPDLEMLIQYINARKLENYGDPEGAIALYDAFPLLDAVTRAVNLSSKLSEDKYSKAMELLRENSLVSCEEASVLFTELGDYRDSPQRLMECRKRITALATPTPVPTPSPTSKPTPTPVAAQIVPVYYRGTDGTLLYTDEVTLLVGKSVYHANDAFVPAGFRLAEDRAVSITVAANGKVLPNVIEFTYYQPITVGSTIYFGKYEQDNNNSNGMEAIAWHVLQREGDKALLISEQNLDAQPYNMSNMSVTWETCTLRKWLNSNFVNSAFTHEERKSILTIVVQNDDHPEYHTDGGRDTRDMVFLLSIEEAENLFSREDNRVAKSTAYAEAQGAYTRNSGAGWWWLRSPGYNQGFAAYVSEGGSVTQSGLRISTAVGAVRPALWLDLASDIF